ncbi:hypothetical protein [Niabella hibiscisoli]|uniref:hypothetical protein n=1 Tax=Niabella hibiscisoli TaxID=1825928 RepID=UPI001F0DE13F|nr:hypothetical protein [Niabella hibiscisoli]MCH5718509.1 hypothetical protein [Niabella hibiscisoli]
MTDLCFSPVCIPDLGAIKELYRKRQLSLDAAVEPAEASPLTADFGCPLYAARCKNTMIGYSYVTVNESGKAVFRTVMDQAYNGHQWEHQLMTLTREQYPTNEWQAKAQKHKEANERLVNWLNSCL